MATTLSRNLKLRISSDLTADSIYNLQRLDLLGATFLVDSANQLNIRSITDILIEPESADIGGSGEDGTVSFGTVDHVLESLRIFASEVRLSSPLSFTSGEWESSIGPSLSAMSSDLSFRLPNTAGASGQVLVTDGSGNLSWAAQSGGGGSGDYAAATDPWTTGTTKVVTHNLGTSNVSVTVRDSAGELVYPAEVVVDNSNQVTITSSEAPSGTWTVLIQGTTA